MTVPSDPRGVSARPGGYALPLVLLALAVGFTVMAQRFGAASRAMPQLVGGTMAIFCLMDAVSRSDTELGRRLLQWANPAVPVASAAPPRHLQWVALVALAALVAMMVFVGVVPAVVAFGLFALRYRAGRSWIVAAALGGSVALAIWLLFGLLLGLPLFPGLLFGGTW
ncbi:MAG TPA: tripartite tricarboxylate transporter TctB family protein [Aliidongia sp.]|nr:tripartite tricarboxylate transporter TctB family protein [Aliidongia sp.]